MLIGLISDTHDNMPFIKKAVDYFNEKGVEKVFHAGDFISPICVKELKELKAKMTGVFGNNDGEKNLWKEKVKGWGEIFEGFHETSIDNIKILLIHEPRHLEPLAISQQYDIIIYGHTHKIDQRQIGKTIIINPGECGAWLTGKSSIALLKLPEKSIEIINLAN